MTDLGERRGIYLGLVLVCSYCWNPIKRVAADYFPTVYERRLEIIPPGKHCEPCGHAIPDENGNIAYLLKNLIFWP